MSCSICLEGDRDDASDLVHLPCSGNGSHAFHPVCIRDWLLSSPGQDCPLCRQKLCYTGCGHSLPATLLLPGICIHPKELEGDCQMCRSPFAGDTISDLPEDIEYEEAQSHPLETRLWRRREARRSFPHNPARWYTTEAARRMQILESPIENHDGIAQWARWHVERLQDAVRQVRRMRQRLRFDLLAAGRRHTGPLWPPSYVPALLDLPRLTGGYDSDGEAGTRVDFDDAVASATPPTANLAPRLRPWEHTRTPRLSAAVTEAGRGTASTGAHSPQGGSVETSNTPEEGPPRTPIAVSGGALPLEDGIQPEDDSEQSHNHHQQDSSRGTEGGTPRIPPRPSFLEATENEQNSVSTPSAFPTAALTEQPRRHDREFYSGTYIAERRIWGSGPPTYGMFLCPALQPRNDMFGGLPAPPFAPQIPPPLSPQSYVSAGSSYHQPMQRDPDDSASPQTRAQEQVDNSLPSWGADHAAQRGHEWVREFQARWQ